MKHYVKLTVIITRLHDYNYYNYRKKQQFLSFLFLSPPPSLRTILSSASVCPVLFQTILWSVICTMWQPGPPDLALSPDSTHYGSAPRVERKCLMVDKPSLRPPPLFRSVGLTGLSAGLPPHRRLRSILHRARAVLPANTNASVSETAHSWPSSGSNSKMTGVSERNLPLKGRIRSSSHTDSAAHGPEASKNSLPNIATHKPSLDGEPCQEGHAREINILTLGSAQAQTEKCKHGHLRPSLIPARTVHRHNSAGHNPPAKVHRQRSIVSPSQQKELHLSETGAPTERLGKKRERWVTSKTAAHSPSERHSSPEKSQENICQWLSSVGITDSGLKGSNRLCGLGEKGPTRRDRRPHFLPPISQSDCLLNVPLVLPENSPPPSPSCVSSTHVFPLHVPTLPLWTKHGFNHT